MPVFALYNFDDADNVVMDSALGNGNQFGYYVNGAVASGGQAVLDGENDFVKIMAVRWISPSPSVKTNAAAPKPSCRATPRGRTPAISAWNC